jgi:molybdate transport system substrate-binding protein
MLHSLSRRAWLIAVAVATPGALMAAPPAGPVLVFAAASLKNALDEIGGAYMAASHAEVRFSYAASSALARQLEQGAPADVFVSADSDWMDYLQARRLIVTASRRDLLTNHLALVAPVASKIRLRVGPHMRLAEALGPGGRLAVAGPDVPAGRYARASLNALGVLGGVKDKFASAENVRAALLFVARGETPLGIVYDTDAKIEAKVRIVGLLPDASHPRIVYPAARVAASHEARAAGFLRFLQGPRASAIFRKYGFVPLS